MGPSGQKKKLLTEINMVPFIDIVLVLLIIFMIVAPVLHQSQVPINLPKSVTSRPVDSDDPVRIQVTREGDFLIDNQRILRTQLAAKLRLALSKNARKAVLIEADRDVSFKNVVMALDAAEKGEASKVGVAVLANTSQ